MLGGWRGVVTGGVVVGRTLSTLETDLPIKSIISAATIGMGYAGRGSIAIGVVGMSFIYRMERGVAGTALGPALTAVRAVGGSGRRVLLIARCIAPRMSARLTGENVGCLSYTKGYLIECAGTKGLVFRVFGRKEGGARSGIGACPIFRSTKLGIIFCLLRSTSGVGGPCQRVGRRVNMSLKDIGGILSRLAEHNFIYSAGGKHVVGSGGRLLSL